MGSPNNCVHALAFEAKDIRHHCPASSMQAGSEDAYNEDKSFQEVGQQARAKKDSTHEGQDGDIQQILVGPETFQNPGQGPSDLETQWPKVPEMAVIIAL
jgi:hypothetical protein